MKFFSSFVLFLILLNGFATAQALIRNSCKKIAAKTPNIKYNLCVQYFEEHPQSRTATTLEGLLVASTKNVVFNLVNVKGIVINILKYKKASRGIEIPLRDCVEVYTDANGSLNEALASIKSRDYRSANVNLNAALDAPTTCETGFKETKQQSPVTIENNVLIQKVLIPLAFTNIII